MPSNNNDHPLFFQTKLHTQTKTNKWERERENFVIVLFKMRNDHQHKTTVVVSDGMEREKIDVNWNKNESIDKKK